AEKTASATDLAAAPATTASVLSQLALASYLYQNGLLLEDNSNNDRNEKALGLSSARGGITATNDDLRVAAGRHAPVGDMHMETVRPLQTRGTLADPRVDSKGPLQTCGALADPRVDSKEFAVGDLEFRADTE
ncbi:hypothetical protein GGF32_005202, partial [Allomyces javanicus]